MTKFRPCIDLHSGQVKQIVGGTLSTDISTLKTNHVSSLPASHFARLYREHVLAGAHVIMLGPGNEKAATEALEAWPFALQVGGGINEENSQAWINRGAEKVTNHPSPSIFFFFLGAENSAEKVIVTKYLFPEAKFSMTRLTDILKSLKDDRNKLVIDLSCRSHDGKWVVAMNKWQTLTDMELNQGEFSSKLVRINYYYFCD